MPGLQSILFLVPFFRLVLLLHPIHVSVTEIEMDEKDKRLEIMMRVFADDLELTLRKSLAQPELDILALPPADVDKLVSAYLKDHFKISIDNKPQKNNYLGHELDDLAFIFYIEAPNVRKWKTIEIQNDIIMETYDDQSNLVHVTVGETVRSLRLTKNNPADNLTFDF
jgi:hypothetical protein